jgi:protease-4
MYRFFVGLFAIIGLIVVLVAGSAGYLLYRSLGQEEALPETIVLDLDLDRSLIEDVPADPILGPLLGRETSLRDIVDALDRGRGDPRVKGVIARFGGDQISYAQAQELRAAVERFRAAGRFAVAFSESFGELSPGDRSYYLASGFDEIWLQPVGMVGLTGVNAQVPFARGTLDELNLQPQLKQRKEYKSFMNSITEHGFTEPHREMMEALVDDLTEQLVAGVAAGRKLEPAAVHSLIDRGPFLDREAVDAGLIDHLGHYDAARAAAEKRAGSGAGRIEAADYLDRAGRPHSEGSTIALIYGVGSITRGDNGIDPLFGGASMGSEDMRKAFEQAVAAPDVEAILFRIDSGGGSAVASETIRRAVQQAREAGKPVIVSMGEKAASGGYWVAMSADRIVAQPATLTGSIGVVAGKIVTEGLWDRIGMPPYGRRSPPTPTTSRRVSMPCSTGSTMPSSVRSPRRGGCRWRRYRTSPKAASGPAVRPRRWVLSMNWAAWTPRSIWRARRPDYRRTDRSICRCTQSLSRPWIGRCRSPWDAAGRPIPRWRGWKAGRNCSRRW